MPWVYGIEAYSNNAFAQLCRLDVYLAKGGCIHLFILIIHGIKIIAIINIKYIIRFFAVLVNNLMQIFSAFAQLLLSKQKNRTDQLNCPNCTDSTKRVLMKNI